MNDKAIYDELFQIIRQIAHTEQTIERDMNLIEDLEFDSIKIVELVVKVEETFGIEVKSFEDLIDAFKSIDDTVNYFARLIISRSLYDVYAAYFPIGTVLNIPMIKRYKNIITDNFTSITPENELKFHIVHPAEDIYDFSSADALVNYAVENRMFVRGHTLIWHESTPKWVFYKDGRQVSREILLERMKEHISTVVGRYKENIYCWDVINEAIDDNEDIFYRNSKWKEIIGEEYIEYAFRYAHEANPGAELYLNDYNACINHKCDKIYTLTKHLLDKGVPIHGIGLQGHYNINFPSVESIKEGIEKLALLGLKIQITEMDISLFGYEDRRDDLMEPSAEMLEKQAEAYGKIFELFRNYKDVITGVTIWGVADDYTWLDDFPVKGRKDWPLLFDCNLRPKSAYERVIKWKDE